MTVTIDGTLGINTPPTLTLQAGTTSATPLQFTAGSLLTTPVAGAVGYDGKVLYVTPQGTQRGVIPGAQFFRLDSGLAGANATGAQNVFGVGVTLSSNTVYAFEAIYALSKSAGTTSHTMGFGFGGAATLNSITYEIQVVRSSSGFTASGTFASADQYFQQTASNSVISAAITSATFFVQGTVKGIVSVNAGGTFIPQYTLSAAPGGAYTTAANCYFLIYPIGASGANTNVGTWA